MKITPGWTYDDLMLIPKNSNIESRKNIDLSTDLGKNIVLKMPLIPSNMKDCCGYQMAKTIIDMQGLVILHRFQTLEEIICDFNKLIAERYDRINYIGCSIGVQPIDYIWADKLESIGCKIICIDIAHGDHDLCLKITEYIAKKYPEILLIAGNIATGDGALRLYNAGANVVKCGIGGGSICTTRINTGNGVPMLTALDSVYNASKISILYEDKDTMPWTQYTGKRKFKIISDGGIRFSGDVTKSLCFSDAVMIGNLFAGTDEAPGSTIIIDGEKYKEYSGSSTYKLANIEGVKGVKKLKGPIKQIIDDLLDGVKSGCSYQNARNLEELRKNPEFVSISNAGLIESHPHDVRIK
jgi:IMP dehydrogenase